MATERFDCGNCPHITDGCEGRCERANQNHRYPIATDLFGAVPPAQALAEAKKRKTIKARGYAMPPGTGPTGHTCGDCKHIYRTDRYRKCELLRAVWTHGYGTDVLARSPACGKWEQEEA